MQPPPPPAPQPPSAAPDTPPDAGGAGSPQALSREIWKALAIVFGGTFVLAIIQWVLPFTASFMQVGLALILLEVPLRLALKPSASNDPRPLWLRIGPLARGLRLGGLTILLVFPLFVAGFHLVYTQLLERPSDWDVARLARWSEDLEYAPSQACGRPETSVWTQEDQLWIAAPRTSRLEVRLVSDRPLVASQLRCSKGSLPSPGALLAPGTDGVYRPAQGVGVFFRLAGATSFTLNIADEHGPISSDNLRQGHRSLAADDDGLIEGSRGYWWLFAYVLIHLGLVAYPEEYFFRGYLLPRLDTRLGTPRRLFGVQVGWGLVLSALAFALLHPILIPGAHRLLVFFPALLFGWLAAKQRELGAAILVHAFSNVLLAIVSRMYS